MSRNVDLSKPLSAEDREYLERRGRMVEIARNDAQFAGDGSDATEEAETPEDPGKAATDAGSTPDAPKDYKSMKVEELKAELDRRKAAYEAANDTDGVADVTYSSTDKKDDLITLLEEDDKAVAEAAAEEDEETS